MHESDRPNRVERVCPGVWVPYDRTPGSEYRRALDDQEAVIANYVLKEELNDEDVITAERILAEGLM